jgi:hypothetical protein
MSKGGRNKKLTGNCTMCGIWRKSLHRDHIVPKFKGGTEDASNIQLLCANCHEDKTVNDFLGKPGPQFSEAARKVRSEKAKLDWKNGVHDVPHMHGKQHTPETRDKIRVASTGRLHAEETKIKMSIAQLNRRERERNQSAVVK